MGETDYISERHHLICLHPDWWAEVKITMAALLSKMDILMEKQDSLGNRIFVDNGKPSIQTQLINIETYMEEMREAKLRHRMTIVENAILEMRKYQTSQSSVALLIITPLIGVAVIAIGRWIYLLYIQHPL